MRPGEWFKSKMKSFKDDFDFRLETLILEITEKICARMNEKEINRKRLSELLNVSPPAVTKILDGNSNFTLKTLLSLSDALGMELKIDFVEKTVAAEAACDSQFGISVPLSYETSSRSASTLATTSNEYIVSPTRSSACQTTANQMLTLDSEAEWKKAA